MYRLLLASLILLMSVAAKADRPPRAILLGPQLLQGGIFEDSRSQSVEEQSESGTVPARDLVLHKSGDGCLEVGVYEAGRNLYTDTEPFPHDEFMLFVDGGVRLQAASGEVLQVKAGDALLIPKGWIGTWDSPGYRKIYLIYGSTCS